MAATTALNDTTRLQNREETLTRTLTGQKMKYRTEQPVSTLSILSLSGLFLCSLLIYFHTVLVENQANKKQMQIIHTKEENSVLQASLAERKSLANVEKKALSLGMQAVDQYHYISLESAVYHQADELSSVSLPANSRSVRTPVGF